MKRLTVALFLLGFLFPFCARNGVAQELSTRDHLLRWTSTALILADWSTTMSGLDRGLPESNPLLGPHPSKGTTNLLIGGTVIVNCFLIPKIRADDLRTFFWGAVMAIEMDALLANRRAGLQFSINF